MLRVSVAVFLHPWEHAVLILSSDLSALSCNCCSIAVSGFGGLTSPFLGRPRRFFSPFIAFLGFFAALSRDSIAVESQLT
jgi:hypothetical protein